MGILKAKTHWDIFCRIVDNYGDIGVCWRLARQLAHEHQLTVRLFVDGLSFDGMSAAQKIIPQLSLKLSLKPSLSPSTQMIDGVEVCLWSDELVVEPLADVVIEAFSCGLPTSYSEKIQLKPTPAAKTSWINLEYLSAETWVDDFHGTASVNPINGMSKHFFFPGFNAATGGLLCEADLILRRDEFLLNTQTQAQFWQQLGVADAVQNSTQSNAQASIKVSLFCYPHAPVLDLLQSMATGQNSINLFVPNHAVLAAVAEFFEVDNQALTVGSRLAKGNLQVAIIPFLSQNDYDKLLWSCDVNFVRGEDSWLRAIWAAKSFIWQPYFQQEQAHLVKLNAFLDGYCHGFESSTNNAMRRLSLAWAIDTNDIKADIANQNEHLANTPKPPTLSNDWADFVCELASYQHHAQSYTQQLSKQPDLAAKLVIFCNK